MKKKLFLLFSLVMFAKTKAQIVFCPSGAEWHYVYMDGGLSSPVNYKNETIKYVHDSLLNGETVKVIRHTKIFAATNINNSYLTCIQQRGDTVFMKSTFTNNQWCILFNFAALPGQSWQIPLSLHNNLTFTVTVDSVNYISLNGYNLKQVFLKYKQPCCGGSIRNYSTSIIERIGGSGAFYLFNFYGGMYSDGDYINKFLCYQDSAFGLKQFTSKSCDYSLIAGVNELTNETPFLKLYPNPTSDILHLTLENQNLSGELRINLVNLLGETISEFQTEKLEESRFEMNLESLKKGVYFLQVFHKEKLIYTTKLIKE